MDNERNTNICFLFKWLFNSILWQTYLFLPGPSFPKSFLFIVANSFTKNEQPGISFQSQCPRESKIQHDMLPHPCVFTYVFLQNSSPSWSLSSYKVANSKPLSKLPPSYWSKSLNTTAVSHHNKLVGHGQKKENQI